MKNNTRKEICIYIVILCLQILVMVYWAGIKSNYFIDDLYSMGYASSLTGEGDNAQYITVSPEWNVEEWVKNSSYKKYIRLSENEGLFNTSASNVVNILFRRRNYFAFLNIAESIAGYPDVTAIPGFVLNVLFFIAAQITFIFLMKKLNIAPGIQYMAFAMFGFCTYIISAVEYVRFYMLIIFLMLLALILFYKVWAAEEWKKIIPAELGILVLAYFSYKNSELAVAFFGAMIGSSLLMSVLYKKRRQLISYFLICLLAICFVFDYIKILFDPGEYSEGKGMAIKASLNIAGASMESVKIYFMWLRGMFENMFFSAFWIALLLMVAVTISLMIVFGKKSNEHKPDIKAQPVTICALAAWTVITSVCLLLDQVSRICILVLGILVIKLILETFGGRTGIRSIKISSETSFILSVFIALIVYTLFEALAGHYVWRYYCYGFVSAVLIFWYVADRALKRKEISKAKKTVMIILVVMVVINALLPFKTRNIEYMYENDRAFIKNVQKEGAVKAVLFLTVYDDGTIERNVVYDCVNLLPDDSYIYAVDPTDFEVEEIDYPDEFVLWSKGSNDISYALEDLKDHGYKVEYLGEDHVSVAYECRLN